MENNACITLKLLLHKHASNLVFILNQKPWTELISIPLAAFCLLKVTRHQQMIQRFKFHTSLHVTTSDQAVTQ